MNQPKATIDPFNEAVAFYEQLIDVEPDHAIETAVEKYPECEAELRQHAEIHQRVNAVCAPLRQAVTSNYLPPTIAGYENLEEIGRGGMGIVYRARQASTGRPVAVKVIRPERLTGIGKSERDDAISRFRSEAMAAADHDHIVRVYYTGEADASPYLVMEYANGVTLGELLNDPSCSLAEVVGYVEQAARALHYAHGQGVLHRDVKPSNILVDRKESVAKVADFGLAKLEHDFASEEAGGSSVVVGTLPYMSPEQVVDSEKVTPSSDVYSLGATLFHAITGQQPFSGDPSELLIKISKTDPPAPRSINPSLPRQLENICLKCLRKNPDERYPSAGELADELASLQSLRGDAAVLFAGMSWLLVAFAMVSGLIHVGVYLCLKQQTSELIIWSLMFATHPLLFAMFWFTKTPNRSDSQTAQRELWTIWLGHLCITAIATFALRWRSSDLLNAIEPAYVVFAAATGAALLCMSVNFWRYHFWLAVGWFLTAVAMIFVSEFAPLMFAGGSVVCSSVIGLYEFHLSRERLLDVPLGVNPQRKPQLDWTLPTRRVSLSNPKSVI